MYFKVLCREHRHTQLSLLSIGGWVRRWYRYHPLPEELGVRLTPHPAQATGRHFKVSDGTPVNRCPRVTFTRTGIELFPWMSPLLPVLSTRHPAMSAPFRGGYSPIRRVMDSPCLSAAGLRFLRLPPPAVDLARSCDRVTGWLQTTTGLPRFA